MERSQKAQEIIEQGDQQNLWPDKMNQKDKKMLAHIAVQYDLDPFFQDLVILGGNPYVTSSGLKRNAHESDDPPASIQLEEVDTDDNKHWKYKAKLWKESTPEDRPFIEYGEASYKDIQLHDADDKDVAAMARTRATNRVLRLAYNISLTSKEELSNYDPKAQKVKDVTNQGRDRSRQKKRPEPDFDEEVLKERNQEIKELADTEEKQNYVKQVMKSSQARNFAVMDDDLYEELVEELKEWD